MKSCRVLGGGDRMEYKGESKQRRTGNMYPLFYFIFPLCSSPSQSKRHCQKGKSREDGHWRMNKKEVESLRGKQMLF